MAIDGFTKVCVSVAALCAVGLWPFVSGFAMREASRSDGGSWADPAPHRWPGAKFDWADVAGTYVLKDDPYYETLTVLPSGVLAWARTDAGLHRAKSMFDLKDDRMLAYFDRPGADGPSALYDSMFPVRWGDRMYLVPEGKILEFVRWGLDGAKGNPDGMYFLRIDPKTNTFPDPSQPPAGKPELPAKYRPFVDPPKVTSVGPRLIKVNEGIDAGFTPETVLAPSFKGTERYHVVSVYAHDAVIAPFGKYTHELKVGDKLQLSDSILPPAAPRKYSAK